ncbi:MAG: hypothetical protein NNA18_04320 [Nitrospira sp.]|nr:hypothetical protein [Nitrospira sp.]
MTRLQKADTVRPPHQPHISENVAQGTARLQEILAAIRDLSQEGFPYQDAAKTKVELQIRECVRQIFGDRSPQFRAFRHYRLRVSTPAEVAQSIGVIQNLLQTIQQRQTHSREAASLASPPRVDDSGGAGALTLPESAPVPSPSQPISTSKQPSLATGHLSTPIVPTAVTTSPPPPDSTVAQSPHSPPPPPTNERRPTDSTNGSLFFSSPICAPPVDTALSLLCLFSASASDKLRHSTAHPCNLVNCFSSVAANTGQPLSRPPGTDSHI